VVILILGMGFTSGDAIPLSNVLIGGAAVASFIILARKKHTKANRPLIHYRIALLMEPCTLMGTIIGVILHEIFPDWLIIILLLLTLGFTIYKTTIKGISLYKAESELKKSNPIMKNNEKQEINLDSFDTITRHIIENERKTPLSLIFYLIFILSFVSIHSLMVGGKGKSLVDIKTCTVEYWILFLTVFPLLAITQFFIVRNLLKSEERKDLSDFPYVEGDIHWTAKKAYLVVFVSIFAGLLSTLIGIGGGMVIGPLLLEFGLLADVAAATSSFMILFTSASSIVQYATLGRIPSDYGLFSFFLGIFYGVVGQTVLDYLVRKYHRKSLIVFSVVVIIAISSVVLLVSGITKYAQKSNQNTQWGFNDYCK